MVTAETLLSIPWYASYVNSVLSARLRARPPAKVALAYINKKIGDTLKWYNQVMREAGVPEQVSDALFIQYFSNVQVKPYGWKTDITTLANTFLKELKLTGDYADAAVKAASFTANQRQRFQADKGFKRLGRELEKLGRDITGVFTGYTTETKHDVEREVMNATFLPVWQKVGPSMVGALIALGKRVEPGSLGQAEMAAQLAQSAFEFMSAIGENLIAKYGAKQSERAGNMLKEQVQPTLERTLGRVDSALQALGIKVEPVPIETAMKYAEQFRDRAEREPPGSYKGLYYHALMGAAEELERVLDILERQAVKKATLKAAQVIDETANRFLSQPEVASILSQAGWTKARLVDVLTRAASGGTLSEEEEEVLKRIQETQKGKGAGWLVPVGLALLLLL